MKVKQLVAELEEQYDSEATVNVVIHGQAFNVDGLEAGVVLTNGNPHGYVDIIPAHAERLLRQK